MVFNNADLESTWNINEITLFQCNPKTLNINDMPSADRAEYHPVIKFQPVFVVSPTVYEFSDNGFVYSFGGNCFILISLRF